MNNTNIISKYYKFTKSYFLSSRKLIVKDSIVVVDKEFRDHKTSGRELLPHYRCTIQGTHSNYNYKKLNKIIREGIIVVEVPLNGNSEEYLNNYVRIPESLTKIRKMLSKFNKKYSQYKKDHGENHPYVKVLETIKRWAFQTKGDVKCVTYKEEMNFLKNPLKFLLGTVFNGGMKSKPGSAEKNRSTRQTPISNEEEWSNDPTTLLPNGIKESDYCTFDESVKIFKKMLCQVLSMSDCPKEFSDFFGQYGYEKLSNGLNDYLYHTPLFFEDFKKNTHHGKIKGLEFCHIYPEIQRPTVVDNVTIGSCESNRLQGGYSKETMRKVFLIDSIVEEGINIDVEYLRKQNTKTLYRLINEYTG